MFVACDDETTKSKTKAIANWLQLIFLYLFTGLEIWNSLSISNGCTCYKHNIIDREYHGLWLEFRSNWNNDIFAREYIPSESIIAFHSIDVCVPFLALNLIWVGSPISNIYARWHDTDIMQRIQYFANL